MKTRPRVSPSSVLVGIGLVALVGPVAGPSHAMTWTRVQDVPVGDVYSVQRHGTMLYAGTAEVVYVSGDGGESWTATQPLMEEGPGVEAVVAAGGALWAATFGNGVYRSPNGGASWTAVNAGLAGLGALQVVELVERAGFLYAGTSGAGVFVLDLAQPTSWAAFNAGLPVETAGSIGAFLLHGTTLLAAAGGNGFVYRHALGAGSWQEFQIVPPIAPGLVPSDLVAHGNTILVGSSARVHRSLDVGATWQYTGADLVNGTEFYLASTGITFFVGFNRLGNTHRIHRSNNDGVNWQPVDDVAAYLYGLEVAAGKLFAARADGLWWTQLETSDREDPIPLPRPRPRLAQNVPNPFNPRTTITFELPVGTTVRLRVYDARGQIVATLVDRSWMNAGAHRIEFGDARLASGVYVYELEAGDTIATRKMVLVR